MLGLPADMIGKGIFWVTLLVVVATLICVVVMLQGYLSPLYTRLEKRRVGDDEAFGIAHKPCCPPGLGCNDEGRYSSGPCRRELAYKLANADEVEDLDRYWSAYNRAPSEAALRAWENVRDTLIAEKLSHAEDDAQKKKLLGQSDTLQLARGEVVDE
jgi:hypothetical protein